jgi:DNA-binding transcriptional MerR regulator
VAFLTAAFAMRKMKTCSISKLGRLFGLSRSTLLYYDRIGLLPPSGRTYSGYRYYTEKDKKRLERICHFREAGLTLADIRACLASGGRPGAKLLEKRLRQMGEEIRGLRSKHRLLAVMLARASVRPPPTVDKQMWVQMLRAAGMDNQAMARWHAEFERRAPDAHQEFLLSLGIPENEILHIREWSRRGERKQRSVEYRH